MQEICFIIVVVIFIYCLRELLVSAVIARGLDNFDLIALCAGNSFPSQIDLSVPVLSAKTDRSCKLKVKL